MPGDVLPTPGTPVVLDSAPLIYLLEEHPDYNRRFAALFRAVSEGHHLALLTPITLCEVFTGALRAGREGLAERWKRDLLERLGWKLCEIGEPEATLAARLRSRHGLRTPDAFQAAVAMLRGAVLITHDRGLERLRPDLDLYSGLAN